jgi:hypothetical protein
MRFVKNNNAVGFCAICAVFSFCVGFTTGRLSQNSVTTSMLSPNLLLTIKLVETNTFIDRRFSVIVEGIDKKNVIYTSPDELNPPGTEQFIWSVDSNYVLLIGRRFAACDTFDSRGNQIYLLYSYSDDKIWCCSKQKNYEPINLDMLDSILFTNSYKSR